MAQEMQTAAFGTAFTVSIEPPGHHDRDFGSGPDDNVLKAIHSKTRPEDLSRPGHVFPLESVPGRGAQTGWPDGRFRGSCQACGTLSCRSTVRDNE